MFELSVERTFCAAHAIVIGGRREPVHGHNWRVTLRVGRRELDENSLVCDFHALERHLDAVIGRFHNGDLNQIVPFDDINPTAEAVARHIARAIEPKLPAGVSLRSVSVAEAPGCTAIYRPNEVNEP